MQEKPTFEKLKKTVSSLKGAKVLVIGDIMLDHFIRGKVNRISPEAPVPIVHVTSEKMFPGGAANVAMNLRILGVETAVIGIVGKDTNGRDLKSFLRKAKIDTKGIASLESIQTTKKTRIIAHSQQIVRFDHETPKDISGTDEERVISLVRQIAPSYQAIIIEDYGKGIITQPIVNEIVAIGQKHGIYTSYDPKIGHDIHCKGINLSTPNLEEAKYLSKTVSYTAKLPDHGENLRKALGLNHLLITLGEDGMALFSEETKPYKIPTKAKEVFDVSGAGDTVISVFTAAAVSGASPQEAAYIANVAGGIVVGKLGIATVTPGEILNYLESDYKVRKGF